MTSKLIISYIPELEDPEEEEYLESIVEFEYPDNKFSSCQTIPHKDVDLPSGEVVNVVSEITKYGNTFTARFNQQRVCSIKTNGDFNIMFISPKGLELYARLEL